MLTGNRLSMYVLSLCRGCSVLYSLMQMCKEGEGNKDAFVQIVNAAPHPMMLLGFDSMLDDLVPFCTVTGNFSVLSVGPTFSLSDFLM